MKAHLDLHQGIIDLEGSEEFVSKYLDEFKKKSFSTLDEEIFPSISQPKPSVVKPNATKTAKIKTKKVEPEEFEIKALGTILSLKEFLENKRPGETVAHRIAAIGYYITKIRKLDSFSEGNIEFAYITLPLNKRPIHLRQACIDAKNRNHYLEEVKEDPGKWRLSRIGEIFVEEKLPGKPSK